MNYIFKHTLLLLLLCCFSFAAFSQRSNINPLPENDALTPGQKEHVEFHRDSLHSPHKAVIRSLIIPGWGQLYNRQWWKVPIIYAGLGLLADAIVYNQKGYAPNLVVAHYYEQGRTKANLPTTAKNYALWLRYQQGGATPQNVYDLLESYRRDRDLSIMGFFGAWGIQMVDAYIDAKFKHSYSMDTDLSIKVTPTVLSGPMYAMQSENNLIIPGIKLTFTVQ